MAPIVNSIEISRDPRGRLRLSDQPVASPRVARSAVAARGDTPSPWVSAWW